MAIDLKKSLRTLPIVRQSVELKPIVVAIDFGTTYSGYAYSFRTDFLEDPLKVKTSKWQEGKKRGNIHETSTCALFTPEKQFHSFGYDAEEKYSELAINQQHDDWYYFRNFKMLLYENAGITVNLQLKAENGNSLPAIYVFSKSIEYLRNHFLREFENTKESHPVVVRIEDIYWVLTVPAIWDDKAKRFMREAAIKAGIYTDRLSIALEPEAASLFCRYVPVKVIGGVGASGMTTSSVGPGDNYLVFDAGGGTIDITAHEIQEDESIKELYAANGGDWGGTSIDKKFVGLLYDIIGADTVEIIVRRYKDDYIHIMSSFEVSKKSFTPDTSKTLKIPIPASVLDTYKEFSGEDLRLGSCLQSHLKHYVKFEGDKIRVDAYIIKRLYDDTCEHIVSHMNAIFNEYEVRNVSKVLMVGGFSESKILQHEMKNAFPSKTFIIPEEAGQAVLKGAVMYGHCPTLIKSRVCRFTYGIEAYRDFQPGLDSPERKVVKKIGDTNYFLCEKSFSVHASRGESIDVGESRGKHEYVPSEPGIEKMKVSIYRSSDRMPVYTDEESCQKLGDVDVVLENTDNRPDRPITVEMIFGDTELKVQLVEKNTGKVKEATFDCLKRDAHC